MEKMNLNEAMALLGEAWGTDSVIAQATLDYEGFLQKIEELTGIEFEPTTAEGD